jgi:Tat protein secretion system quality control protein TatD with DNase activity
MAAKLQAVVAHLPLERILLESDEDERRAVPHALSRVCEALAVATGKPISAIVELCHRNAARFLRRAVGP